MGQGTGGSPAVWMGHTNMHIHTRCIPVRLTLTDGITQSYNPVTVLEHTQSWQLTLWSEVSLGKVTSSASLHSPHSLCCSLLHTHTHKKRRKTGNRNRSTSSHSRLTILHNVWQTAVVSCQGKDGAFASGRKRAMETKRCGRGYKREEGYQTIAKRRKRKEMCVFLYLCQGRTRHDTTLFANKWQH